MNTLRTTKHKTALLVLGGILAGFINGLLGAGGGILVVFILGKLLSDNAPTALDKKDILANALASMLPVTAVSVVSYASRGSMNVASAEIFVIPAVLGGVCGAFLLDKMNAETARRIFTLIVILSGIIMLIR